MNALDNPVWNALTGPQRALGAVCGGAARFLPDVAPFSGLEGAAWTDLAGLLGPGGFTAVVGGPPPPAGWELTGQIPGVQLVASAVEPASWSEACPLGAADVPEMLDLVARTKPGPFKDRTIELGTFLGIRRGGTLVAMAGERMRPPGWTEISGVCTDPAYRGQGLGGRLVRAVAWGIVERGDRPFLHTAETNVDAIRLYEALGFTVRRPMSFDLVRAPA